MKPAAVLLVAAAAWAQVPVETVALGTTAERPAVSQAAMTDLVETVGTVHAFSGLQIQTVLAAEPRRQPQTLPIYVGVCPRVPRLRSERASKFVKDQ